MLRIKGRLGIIGPGLAIAATGIGAGDMVASTVAGARYGETILWAVIYGAILKLVLNEGIARWQLATGQTLLEGWLGHLGRWTGIYFGIYLLLWSFIVAGALMAACGLAGSALFGGLSVRWWGAIHSLVALALVWFGRYIYFERFMKLFIAALFLIVLYGALATGPDWPALVAGLAIPRIPSGSAPFILGVIGGVGGSVTLLSYGYWIREKGWEGPSRLGDVRLDLGVAYLLVGLFGVAIIVIAAGVSPEGAGGQQLVLEMANRLETVAGPIGRWSMLIGFWAAVFSSMIGVWQGIPYLFADGVATWRAQSGNSKPLDTGTRSSVYRGYLIYMAAPPMLLLLVDRPVWIIVAYAIMGAFFMPFLAGTLLALNRRRELLGQNVSSPIVSLLLWLSLGLFGYLAIAAVTAQFQ